MLDKARNLILDGYVGLDRIPDQLVNKSVQNGFIFNILCIGETGIGKTTLMDSLFNATFDPTPSSHFHSKVKIKSHIYHLEESTIRMKLGVVDTLGFGDQVNKQHSFNSILDHIDLQFEAYLQEELKVKRSLPIYQDTRIHACLYFLCPTGHGLKSLDLVCMKKLQSKVNIIPIIAKADTVSKAELQKFKDKIISELISNGLKIYHFPTDDPSVAALNAEMNAHLPFAVIGSTDVVRVGNEMVRGRQYPWGTVQLENESHSDFVKLREMLIRTNLEDMREITHQRYYELYRKSRLEQMGFSDDVDEDGLSNFREECERKRLALQQELAQKEEDLKQQFILKVKHKENELKEAERELQAKFDYLKEVNAKEKKRLEIEEQQLEEEMEEFQLLKRQFQGVSAFQHSWSLVRQVKK